MRFYMGWVLVTGLLLLGATQLGSVLVLDKPTLPTCSATYSGGLVQQLGGASEGNTKLCVCKSDGAASPAYQWCSLTVSEAAVVVCIGGSATVCP